MKKYFGLLLLIHLLFNTFISAQLWTIRYNGSGNGDDAVKALVTDNSGNTYVAGSTYTGNGNYDFLTIKYNSSGVQQWQARYNGPGNGTDQANAIFVDNVGNVYVTGYSYQQPYYGNMDVATVKYNAQGAQQWVARFDGVQKRADVGTAIKVDASGNVIVTGWTTDTHASYARKDYVTIKYSSSGAQQWANTYNGPGNKDDVPSGIGIDASGNVYVSGTSYAGEYTGQNDILTLKYNAAGVKQWEKRYNGPANGYDYGNSVVVDNSGAVYVTGACLGNGTDQDYVTIKYNTNGIQQWLKNYDGPGHSYDISHAIAVDGSGNVYVTGESMSASFKTDYCTIKYNSSGVQQWNTRYNGPANDNDVANAIAVDVSGNSYVTGYLNGLVEKWDIGTVKYSTSGSQQWVKRYDGTGHKSDVGNAAGVDLNGDVYITGNSAGASSGVDLVTIKYGPSTTGSITARQQDVSEMNDPANFALKNYPNPFTTYTIIRFTLQSDEKVKLMVYDMQGSEVAILVDSDLKAGSHEVKWTPAMLPSGNYIYKLSAGESAKRGKMMLVRE